LCIKAQTATVRITAAELARDVRAVLEKSSVAARSSSSAKITGLCNQFVPTQRPAYRRHPSVKPGNANQPPQWKKISAQILKKLSPAADTSLNITANG
jgi:hypothetical protein